MALPPLLKTRRYAQRDVPNGLRGGVVACDSFQRADSSTVGSTNGLPYLPGRPGIAWSEVAGNWEIKGNRMGSQGSSPGGQGWLLTLDIGVSDYQLEWTLAYTMDASTHGIVVGYVDGTNYLRFTHTATAIGGLKVTAGTPSAIGSGGVSAVPVSGDTLSLTKVGNVYTYRVVRAGALIGAAFAATEAQGTSSTIVGLRAGAASIRWTNFVARR